MVKFKSTATAAIFSRLIALSALVLVLASCGNTSSRNQTLAQEERKVVIFDTDMGNDVDDVLALQMLFNYEKQGLVTLKGISISKNNAHAIPFVDGLCRFNGFDDIPLGFAYNGVTPEDNTYLIPTLKAEIDGETLMKPQRFIDSGVPEGYLALRQWLSECEDGEVYLIATGPLTNIANLLNSGPDEFSDLNGVDLVKRKCLGLFIMSGYYTESQPEYNVVCDIPASKTVYSKCPVRLVTSGWEVGAAVKYPHESILNDFGNPAQNPLSVAYMSYLPMPYDRECWDLTTVFDALEPDDSIFRRSESGTITVDDKGVTTFSADAEGLHQYLIVSNADAAISTLVERVTGKPFTGHGMELLSPDSKNKIDVSYEDNRLTYTLFRNGVKLYSSKRISMTAGNRQWAAGDRVNGITRNTVREDVDYTVRRKYAKTENSYNEMTLDFGDYDLQFRAYDSGVAYRFVGKVSGEAEINEKGGYVFPEDYPTYTQLTVNLQNWFEEQYTEARLSELDRSKYAIEPVLVKAEGVNVLFADANTYNYAGSYLQADGHGYDLVFPAYPAREELIEMGDKRYVTERCDYIVKCDCNRSFPWRVAGIFDKDTDIFKDDLIYLLSDKAEEDYSWVKPGKVLWDWWNDSNITGVDFVSGINTETYLYLIDYAAAHNFEYVLFDAGWSSRNDMLSVNPDTDIPAVCAYAKEKGVGVCLWATWVNVNNQMEEAFKQLSDWGVAGIKIDYMDRNDAYMVNFYERVAKIASEYHMLVDFHGAYPNEGMRAKYPNMLTREGVAGLEYNKMRANMDTPRHELLIPFIRQWVGPMDFTPGAMLNAQPEQHRVIFEEPMSMGTRCHQLAMYVIYESPMQMVSDSPDKYDKNPECFDFICRVPAVWDDTHVLEGELGERIAIARRNGENYYVGIMRSGEAEEMNVDLSFLPQGRWRMTMWTDGPNASHNAKDYVRTQMSVDNNTVLPVKIARNGGFAAVIERD